MSAHTMNYGKEKGNAEGETDDDDKEKDLLCANIELKLLQKG